MVEDGPGGVRVDLGSLIRGLRLDQARRDLLDPRLAGRPIASIACVCGFGDLSGFNRAFKEAYGVSPKELRPRNPRPGQVPPGAASDTKARSAKSS